MASVAVRSDSSPFGARCCTGCLVVPAPTRVTPDARSCGERCAEPAAGSLPRSSPADNFSRSSPVDPRTVGRLRLQGRTRRRPWSSPGRGCAGPAAGRRRGPHRAGARPPPGHAHRRDRRQNRGTHPHRAGRGWPDRSDQQPSGRPVRWPQRHRPGGHSRGRLVRRSGRHAVTIGACTSPSC
jgi:hypothetical protein